MRRSKQALSLSQCLDILGKATSGVLCLTGEQGPYGVPMSYALMDKERIYFHCAREGEKVRLIQKDPRAAFTVIFRDDVQKDQLTTFFQSVISRGLIRFVEDEKEKVAALRLLASRYGCRNESFIKEEISRYFEKVLVLRMDIQEMTGKQARELVGCDAV